MPALESRRLRTQPLTVIAASFGASPAKILRTLNGSLSMHGDYHNRLLTPNWAGLAVEHACLRTRTTSGVEPAVSEHLG